MEQRARGMGQGVWSMFFSSENTETFRFEYVAT